MTESTKRALIVCAHDDDEVLGPGGTICKLVNSGAKVSTLIFATGNEGYSKLPDKDKIIGIRIAERLKAQKILGTSNYITRDYNDFCNLDCEDVYLQIIRTVRLVKPDIIFAHLSADYLAHRTLANVVPEAVWQAGWQVSMAEGDPWTVTRLYLFSILDLIEKPTHIIDISDVFGKKIEAMKAYHSQVSVVPEVLEGIEARARVYGAKIGVQYGEAFVRSNYTAIPLNDVNQLFIS